MPHTGIPPVQGNNTLDLAKLQLYATLCVLVIRREEEWILDNTYKGF